MGVLSNAADLLSKPGIQAQHGVFYDPYERANVWSHLLPGLVFLALGAAVKYWVIGPMAVTLFCCSAATTHLLSALTHVYPDDHFLEKLDHLGIAGLIMGTTSTAIMVSYDEPAWGPLQLVTLLLFAAAFLRPVLRTLTFVVLGLLLITSYLPMVNANLMCQCLVYTAGGGFFLRNGGHSRPQGLSDHHMLHYAVTLACTMHLFYLWEGQKVVVA